MLPAMRRPWLAGAWALTLITAALALERFPPRPDGVLGRLIQTEPAHLVAHALLYGTLAALLAWRWFPADALDAPRDHMRRRALAAGATFLLVAGAQELAQALSRGRGPGAEEYFDLAVDVAGACLGMIAWAAADRRRRYPVARALGVVLHPAALGPLGLFAVLRSALGDGAAALGWTALGVAAAAPVAAVWALGLRRGWFGDRDVSVRAERPRFLLAALLCATALYGAVVALDAPAAVRLVAAAGALASALVAASTVAGLKVSGHVAVPVGVVALLQATSFRGPWPFLLAAVALSWARVREGRHTPPEVLGAWGIAGASGALTRWVG
jgi:VanZ family protein